MLRKLLVVLVCCVTGYCYNETNITGIDATINVLKRYFNEKLTFGIATDATAQTAPNTINKVAMGTTNIDKIKTDTSGTQNNQSKSEEQLINSSSTNKELNTELNQKYEKWLEIVQDTTKISRAFEFFAENPHWPLFRQTIREVERHIKDDPTVTTKTLIEWFKKYPPMTKEGVDAYIDVLKQYNSKMAEKYIKQTYVFQNLEPNYVIQFRDKYNKYITAVDDAMRAKRFAQQGEIKQLLVMEHIAIDDAIAQYIKNNINKNVKFDNSMLFDASARYKYVETLINQGDDLNAARVLNITSHGENDLFIYKKYFEKRRYIAYNMLRAGKSELAYNIANQYPKNIDNDNRARIEWLLGFICYRFHKKFPQAQTHFENAYKYSEKSIRKSKNAFWLAELFRKKTDVVAALEWYRKVAEHFSTFYGYLADVRMQQLSNTYTPSYENNSSFTKNIPTALEDKFYKRELVQVLIATQATEQNKKYRKFFYNKLIDEIEDPYEEILLINLAKRNNEIDTLINKFNSKQHYLINVEYNELEAEKLIPVTNINPSNCFVSTVHSLIKQESAFKSNAKSSAGAMGLMQLMPKTAEAEAKRLGISYEKKDLYNAYNNLKLGSNLLNRLMNKYDNDFVYVFYAYNAGESNLMKYKKSIQNLTNLSILEKIELIPIKETRLYIKNILRNMFYYHQRFNCENQTQLIDNILRTSSW